MTVERRVVMLSRGERLATFAVQALGNGRSLVCLDSPAELADWDRPPIGMVLLDLPRHQRGIVYRQLRQRYRGPVLALLDPDDDGRGLPPDRGPLAILHRPFSGEELSDVLGRLLTPPGEVDASAPTAGTGPPPPAPGPEAPPPPAGPGARPPPPLPGPSGSSVPLAPSAPSGLVVPSGSSGSPGPSGPTPASRVAEHPVQGWAGRWWRWSALARGLRRWEVVVGASALLLLGLSFGAGSGCGSGCVDMAGATEGRSPGALASPDVGPGPRPLPRGSTATQSTVPLGSAGPGTSWPAPGTSVISGLISSLSTGTGSPSLLISSGSATTAGGALLAGTPPTTSSPVSNPPTTSPPTTSPPPTTKPPTTTAPTTTAPTTTAPTTTAPTTTTALARLG